MPSPQPYDPINPAPYQPVQVAEPTPPKPSPFEGQPGFQFQGRGNISHAGAIAGVFDNVLRGFVNGHAQGEAHKALTMKKKSDDLNASYNADAQRLYQMHVAGVDEKTPEYQAAKSAVDGSWGALQDYRGQLINGPEDGKKKPSKKKTNQDETHPIMALTNPAATPQEKAQALYAMSQKAGPPVYGQIAALKTPQAQQARATAATQAQAQGVGAQNTLTRENDISRRNALTAKPSLTPEETAEMAGIEKRLGITAPEKKEIAVTWLTGPDKVQHPYQVKDGKYIPVEVPAGMQPPSKSTDKPGDEALRQADELFKKMHDNPKYVLTGHDHMVLRAAGYEKEPASSGVKRGTPAQFRSLNNQTRAAYQRAQDKYDRMMTNALSEPEKKAAYDELQQSNRDTAEYNSQQTRELGGIPAEDRYSPSSDPVLISQSYKGRKAPGMISAGNLDLTQRPNIDNGDGTHSSTFSWSFGTDAGVVLVPGVGDGKTYPARKLTSEEALDQYKKTKQSFGTFKDEPASKAYAKRLHLDQQKFGNTGNGGKLSDREEKKVAPNLPASPPGGWPKLTPDKVRVFINGKVQIGPRANLAKALAQGAVEIK